MGVLFLVAPAYNEAGNIEEFIRAWYPVIERHSVSENSRLVVIDDGSLDNTYALLSAMSESRPLLLPLTKENSGHGSTVLFGYRFALERGADYVFQTDSDGQTSPDEFEMFWARREQYDAIFGKRIRRGDGVFRAFVEQVVCLLVRVYFGVRVPDANAPYRLMNRSYIESIIPLMPEDYNLPNIILTALGPKLGKRVCFYPVSFKARTTGRNSINVKKIVCVGWRALNDFASIRHNVKSCEKSFPKSNTNEMFETEDERAKG